MSKSIQFAALLATPLCWAAPAQSAIPAAVQHRLDSLTDQTHKWRDCPADEAHATADNPYYKFNPSTADPKFSCRQIGPFVLSSVTWPGTEPWFYQHARFLRVKPCQTYPACSLDKGECVRSMYCKVEAVRVCTLAYVGKPQPDGPFGDGTGKNGCEMIWTEETQTQPPK